MMSFQLQMEYLLASEAACCGKLILSKWQNIKGESEEDLVSHILTHLNRSLTGIQCKRQFQPKDVLTADWSALRAEDFLPCSLPAIAIAAM